MDTPPRPRRSIHAPTTHINFLPAEILQRIFLICLWTPYPSRLGDSPHDVSQLALTCKRWYDLVFGFPAIWSHFVMDFGPQSWPIPGCIVGLEFPMHKLYRAAEVFFDTPLGEDVSVARSLVLKMPWNAQKDRYVKEYDEFCEFFNGQGRLRKDTAATIREAEFCLDPIIALSVFYALKRGGPTETAVWSQLTTLTMTATWGWPMEQEAVNIIVAEGKLVSFMPHLVHLTLKVHDVHVWKMAIPWGQLLTLELHTMYSLPKDLLEIVHKCPKVQRLRLQIGYWSDWTTRRDPKCVMFPALENLQLYFDLWECDEDGNYLWQFESASIIEYFLKGISAPNLEGLHLICIRDKIYVREAVFRSFIDKCRGLKSLYLGLVSFIHDLPVPACQQQLHEITIEMFTTVLAGLPKSLELLGLMYRGDDPRVPPEFYWLDRKQNECGTFLPNVRTFYLGVVEERNDAPGVIDRMVEEIGHQAFFRARSVHNILGHADPRFNGGVEGAERCRCARIPSWGVWKVVLEKETLDWFFAAFIKRLPDEDSNDLDVY